MIAAGGGCSLGAHVPFKIGPSNTSDKIRGLVFHVKYYQCMQSIIVQRTDKLLIRRIIAGAAASGCVDNKRRESAFEKCFQKTNGRLDSLSERHNGRS